MSAKSAKIAASRKCEKKISRRAISGEMKRRLSASQKKMAAMRKSKYHVNPAAYAKMWRNKISAKGNIISG